MKEELSYCQYLFFHDFISELLQASFLYGICVSFNEQKAYFKLPN